MALKTLDDSLLEGRLPPALFYNLLISARAPAAAPSRAARRAPVAVAP